MTKKRGELYSEKGSFMNVGSFQKLTTIIYRMAQEKTPIIYIISLNLSLSEAEPSRYVTFPIYH